MADIKGKMLDLIKNKKSRKIIIISVIAILLLVAAILTISLLGKEETEGKKEIITGKPQISTIELTVSGSGTLQPYDRYEIVSLVSGDINEAPFEEGDLVNEDDIIYVIDHEEQDKSIESAKNSITKYKIRNKKYLDNEEFNKTLEKYTIRAESDGVLSGFTLKVDDKVNSGGKIGTVQNFDEIIATVPFNAAQFAKINEGDKATVYLYPSMYTISGEVTYKSYTASGFSGGAVYYDVEITIKGENFTLTDTSASATVHTLSGDVEAPASGTLAYAEPKNILSEVSGEVVEIPHNIKNGAKVKKGDIILKLDTADFLEEKTLAGFEYNDLILNLENAEERLDNYKIKAPISGTVITKNYKKGDTISGGGNSSASLMVIADMSAMKFIFSADETDINKLAVGQEVIVRADAVENKIFKGVVETVATEGTSSNGVSYYDVTVVVENYGQNDEEGTLRSGMNVTAEIVYEKAENALCVPVSAVTTINKESYVFVKGNASSEEATENTQKEDKKIPENKTDDSVPSGDKKVNREDMIKERLKAMTPEGFTAVKVEVGASNGMYVAILSGLSADDEVYLAESNSVKTPVSQGQSIGLTGGMPGGMMGGGMPSGMMGGGMPGGMMGGNSGNRNTGSRNMGSMR